MDTIDFLKLLLAPDRLAVVGAIATTTRTVDDIVAVTGVERRTALETLAALRDGTAVVESREGYRLDVDVLIEVAQSLPQPSPPDRRIFHGMTEDEQEVIGRFFRGERLTEIPSSHGKRLVVLERLALEFEPGRRYPEPEVNELLGRFHPDYASLRRYLVEEGLLDREHRTDGVTTTDYWRSGGRVLTDERPHPEGRGVPHAGSTTHGDADTEERT